MPIEVIRELPMLKAGVYVGKTDPELPCWNVLGPGDDRDHPGPVVFTLHHQAEKAAVMFAGMMAETSRWDIVYVQRHRCEQSHEVHTGPLLALARDTPPPSGN